MAEDKKNEKRKAAYEVVQPFFDKNDKNIRYEKGDDVSKFDEERLKAAIARGLVKKN